MVSGRNISAAEAIDCGLVDELVTQAAASPVEIAMERLRDYFAQQGPLSAAQEEHQKSLAARDQAIPYAESILEQPAARGWIRHKVWPDHARRATSDALPVPRIAGPVGQSSRGAAPLRFLRVTLRLG